MCAATFSLRARWVFPVDADPIPDGVVTVEGERIAKVGLSGASPTYDLGNAAVVPGFVNAHTHLEFSDLDHPLVPSQPFDSWIRELVSLRHREGRDRAQAVERGLRECARQGTTLVGEIASSPEQASLVERAVLRCAVFLELLGLSPERAAAQEQAAARHLRRPPQENLLFGLSPHAPYSVRPSLLREAVRLASQYKAPLAIHLAETPEEIELLSGGTGPLATMLKELGAWESDVFASPRRPLDLLRELAHLPRTLVVHGNYFEGDEIELLARHRDNLTVVYCPRTHAYFGHPEHPFRRMLAAGAAVAVGTDSRASNPDLSVLEELRFLQQRYPEIGGSLLLRLGTLAGAAGLGQAERAGSLRAGKRADLAVVALPEREEPDPHWLLFASDLPVRATLSGGRWVYSEFADLPAGAC